MIGELEDVPEAKGQFNQFIRPMEDSHAEKSESGMGGKRRCDMQDGVTP